MEFLDGVFTHLALVNNPRYERANIVFNSKTYNVDNGGNGSGHHNHAGIKGFRSGSLPRGYNTNFINELDNFIKTATEDKYYNGEIAIGSLSKYAQRAADNYNIDLNGYIHTIDGKAIRHRNNHHLKGEINDITDDDLKLIPYIIYNPDKVTYYQRKQNDHINYEKKFPNGDYLYIEEVRNNNKTLTLKTIYKKSAAPNADNSTNEVTSKTSAGNNIINYLIDNSNPNVNENEVNNSYDFAECEALAEVLLEE